MQLYQNATTSLENQALIEETAVVLELLAVTMALIATPNLPPVVSRYLALLGYNTALNWAEMLTIEKSSVVAGGAA